MTPDLINGLFEFVGSLMIWANVARILKDKEVKGIDWRVTGFFWVWGLWNLFYYPHLDQWWSFAGGVSIVVANTVWLALAWYYTHPRCKHELLDHYWHGGVKHYVCYNCGGEWAEREPSDYEKGEWIR